MRMKKFNSIPAMPLARTLYNIYAREGGVSWLYMPDTILVLTEDFCIFQFPNIAVDGCFLHTRGSDNLTCGYLGLLIQQTKNLLLKLCQCVCMFCNIRCFCSLLTTKGDGEEALGGEGRRGEVGIEHVLLHTHDAGTDMLHEMHPREEREHKGVARQAAMAEVLGHQGQQAAGIGNLHAVVIHLDTRGGSLFVVVPMGEGIENGFLEHADGNLPYLTPGTGTFHDVAHGELALQPSDGLRVLLQQRAAEGLVVYDEDLVRSLELHTAGDGLKEVAFGMGGKEHHAAALDTTEVVEELKVLEDLLGSDVAADTGFATKGLVVLLMELCKQIHAAHGDGIEVDAVVLLKELAHIIDLCQLLAVGSLADIDSAGEEVGFVATGRNVNNPNGLAFDNDTVHLVVERWRHLADATLNGRTGVVVNVCADNLILIVDTNKHIAAVSVGETAYFLGDLAHLGGDAEFEIYVLSFALEGEVKDLLRGNHKANNQIYCANIHLFPRNEYFSAENSAVCGKFRGKLRQYAEKSAVRSPDMAQRMVA